MIFGDFFVFFLVLSTMGTFLIFCFFLCGSLLFQAPNGMLTTSDFRTLILPQLFDLKSSDVYTPEAISRLRLDYTRFENWVMGADLLKEEHSSVDVPEKRELLNSNYLTPAPEEIVSIAVRRNSVIAQQRGATELIKKKNNSNSNSNSGSGSGSGSMKKKTNIRHTRASLLRSRSHEPQQRNGNAYYEGEDDDISNGYRNEEMEANARLNKRKILDEKIRQNQRSRIEIQNDMANNRKYEYQIGTVDVPVITDYPSQQNQQQHRNGKHLFNILWSINLLY